MRKNIILGVALLALAATGCKTQKSGFIEQPKPNLIHNVGDDMNSVNKILHGMWNVQSVNGEAVKGEDRPYVVFDAVATNAFMSKFYAYNGCNVINGQVSLTPAGKMMKSSEYLNTLKYCPDAQYEIGVTMVLENIASYRIEKIGEEYLLYLTATNPQQNMVLRRSDLGFLNGAWRVARIYDKAIDEDAGIQMVIDIPEGKVHGNAGCNVMNGEIMTDPSVQHSFRFSNLITTRMTCPSIDLEQQLLQALNQVTSAYRDGGDNAAILRDSAGKNIVELRRITLTHEVDSEE